MAVVVLPLADVTAKARYVSERVFSIKFQQALVQYFNQASRNYNSELGV